MSEEKALQMAKTLDDVVRSLNGVVKTIDSLQKLNVPEKAIEAHYMLQTILGLLTEKGVINAADIEQMATKVQVADLGWTPKPEPAQGALGDILQIKFQIFDGQTLVDDQTSAPFAYTLGSGALSCDDALIGIKAGEQRTCTAVFGPGFSKKDYIGKELTIVVLCLAVMLPAPATT